MNTHISKDEFTLLAWLHENAEGYSDEFSYTEDELANHLGWERLTLRKAISYLDGLELLGAESISTYGNPIRFVRVWLTADGENFMRELEAQPGIAKTITTKTVGWVWETGQQIVIGVLTAYLATKYGQ